MIRLVALALVLSGCVNTLQRLPPPDAAAVAPDEQNLYLAAPQVVPTGANDAYAVTLQTALAYGFQPVKTDAASGLLVLTRVERDDYATAKDPRRMVHVREFTLTIVVDRSSATISPTVTECVRRRCAAVNELIESEAHVIRQIVAGIDPPTKPTTRETTSL